MEILFLIIMDWIVACKKWNVKYAGCTKSIFTEIIITFQEKKTSLFTTKCKPSKYTSNITAGKTSVGVGTVLPSDANKNNHS
jgi:hypothetical protein